MGLQRECELCGIDAMGSVEEPIEILIGCHLKNDYL
jgi:hypothetical protein